MDPFAPVKRVVAIPATLARQAQRQILVRTLITYGLASTARLLAPLLGRTIGCETVSRARTN
eukprot:8267461-Pyramimonas_sp.AAC.1